MTNFFIYQRTAIFNSGSILISKDNDSFFYLRKDCLVSVDKKKINLDKYEPIRNYYFTDDEITILNQLDSDAFLNFCYENLFFLFNYKTGEIILYADHYRYIFSATGTLLGTKNTAGEEYFLKYFLNDFNNEDISSNFLFRNLVPSLKKNISRDLNSNEVLFLENFNNKRTVDNIFSYYSSKLVPSENNNNESKELISITPEHKPALISDSMGYRFDEMFFIYKHDTINILDVASISFEDNPKVVFKFKGNSDRHNVYGLSEDDFSKISEYFVSFTKQYNKKSSETLSF